MSHTPAGSAGSAGSAGYDTDADKAANMVRTAAKIVGAVFLLVGILGFIPGITTDYDTMTFAGHDSDASLLGIFEVSILHNIVHLLFGVAGLAMAKDYKSATSYLVGGGIIYLVLALYGSLIDHQSGANFVPVNTADNWLHLVLGLGMIALGLIGGRAAKGDRAGAASPR
jgi:hypothetical protein